MRVGDLVRERLLSAGNGVRRYEGDRYYGGQPWPVGRRLEALRAVPGLCLDADAIKAE